MRDVKRGKGLQSQRDGYEKASDVVLVSLSKCAMERRGYLKDEDEGSGMQTANENRSLPPDLPLRFGTLEMTTHCLNFLFFQFTLN